jgi:putative membrane protein
MKRHLLLASVAFSLLSPIAVAQDANSQLTEQFANLSAQEFVAMAASSDMFEIQSSQLALENARSDEVKEFAQEMIQDHTQHTQQLMEVAQEENLSAPSEMAEMHQELMQTLSAASGDEFDAAYAQAQVQAHQIALALMTGYAENGDNEDLQAQAQKAAPIIQEHLEGAQELAGS